MNKLDISERDEKVTACDTAGVPLGSQEDVVEAEGRGQSWLIPGWRGW